MSASIDQQFIEYIVKSLVSKPDDIKIERRIDEKGVLLELSVDPEDLGRVIGKRGSTAQSLRTLLRALGTKNDARYNLKIVDTGPPPPRREDSQSAKPADDQSDDSNSDDVTDNDQTAEEPEEPKEDSKTEDKPADDIDMNEDDELPDKPSEESHEDVISRTRKELADLDDLDL